MVAASALFGPLEAPEVMDPRIGKILRDCFKQVDEEVLFNSKVKDGDRSGTTAVIAINIDNVSLPNVLLNHSKSEFAPSPCKRAVRL